MTKDKLKKLLALAEKGVGGEKENARDLLEKKCAELGISIDDLYEADQPELYFFTYKGEFERKILIQIAGKVLRWKNDSYYKIKNSKTKYGKKVTKTQIVEIEMMFDIYKRDFLKQVNNLLDAFLLMNDLLAPPDAPCGTPPADEDINTIMGFANHINKTHVNKQIEKT